MSSLFEVPVQLALVLSLTAAAVGKDVEQPARAPKAAPLMAPAPVVAQRLEGPFRFSEVIWLRALKETPPGAGARKLSDRIFQTSGGRYYVPADADRRQILQARRDHSLAQAVARSFAESNVRLMKSAIGRKPTAGDLYIAHLFGREAAADLIKLAKENPHEAAAQHFPALTLAEPGLFAASKTPLSNAALYARLTRPLRMGAYKAKTMTAAGGSADGRPAGLNLKPTVAGFMRNERASDPVSEEAAAVAWQTKVNASMGVRPFQ